LKKNQKQVEVLLSGKSQLTTTITVCFA